MLTGKFFVTTALEKENTYFLFREITGNAYIEVELNYREDKIYTDKPLEPHEAEWLKRNIMYITDREAHEIWEVS